MPTMSKSATRAVALEREEGQFRLRATLLPCPASAQRCVPPGRPAAIDEVVEDTCALVRHPDLVGVREGEGDAHVHPVPGFADEVAFDAEVSGRFLDPRQDLVKRRPYLVRRKMIHEYAPLRVQESECI